MWCHLFTYLVYFKSMFEWWRREELTWKSSWHHHRAAAGSPAALEFDHFSLHYTYKTKKGQKVIQHLQWNSFCCSICISWTESLATTMQGLFCVQHYVTYRDVTTLIVNLLRPVEAPVARDKQWEPDSELVSRLNHNLGKTTVLMRLPTLKQN